MKKKPTKFADGTRPVECVCCGGYNPECEAHDGPPPEFEIVSGDAAQRANPNAKLMVNTTRHWIVSAESFTSRMEAGKRIAELAALRARIAELEAKPEPPTPEVGKVYWARRLYKGMPCGPFRLQVLALTPKIIEYRENNWSGIRSAIMRDDLEIVEETTWE